MSLEDYIRDQEAKLRAERDTRNTASQMKEKRPSTRDPAEAGHKRDGI